MRKFGVSVVYMLLLFCVCNLGLPQDQSRQFTMGELFRAKGFFPSGAEEIFPVDSEKMLKNFTSFSKGIKNVKKTDKGIKFHVTEDKAQLTWGNQNNTQPLKERINLWSGNYEIQFQVRQSQKKESLWSLRFWSEDKRERPRKDKGKYKDIPLKGDKPQTLKFIRNVRFIYRAPSPDGIDIIIQNAKDSEIEIISMRLVRKVNKGYFRKVFTVPEGKIWRAIATVGVETVIYVNGKEVADKTVKTPRPYPYAYFRTRSVDLKPYLKPGKNCIALKGEMRKGVPCVYLQAKIIMEDGAIITVNTDETWKWSKKPAKEYKIVSFDDSQWLNVTDEKNKKDLKVKNIIGEKRIPQNLPLPAYDGYMVIESPYERCLFYKDVKPAVVTVKIPAGLKPKKPVIYWEVKKYNRNFNDKVFSEPVANGKADQFKETNGSLIFKLDLGKFKRGVYSVQTKLKLEEKIIEERVPEPFVVVGEIPMKKTKGEFYEQDMDLKLETEIDFTNPADPHPWLEVDGSNIPGKGDPLKHLQTAKKQDLKAVITTENSMKYRETRPFRSAQFSYQVEFKHPGDFYLMVLEYPDNKERWMGASCSSRWKGIVTYSKIGPAVITGWKYPVTNTMKKLKWIYRPEPGLHNVNIINLKTGMKAAAARLQIFHIKGGLPKLVGHESGKRFLGLLTENTNPKNTFGHTFSITGSKEISEITTRKQFSKRYYANQVTADFQPVTYFCKDLCTWLDASEAYTEYLQFTGQNLHVIGDYQYWDRPDQTTYMPVPDISTSRLPRDIRDIAVRVFRENNISILSAVEFIKQSALTELPEANMNNTQILLGAETLYLVDKDGQQYSTWNFLNPKVEKAMLRVADEIADKWKEQPNFLGICWMAYLGTQFAIPTYRLGEDPLQASYDDGTIKLFELDTGITVPDDGDLRLRFNKRYEFLTAGNMRERWIKWRCEKIKAFFEKLRDRIRQKRKNLKCYVNLYINVAHASEWKESGLPLRDYLRNSGWDLESFRNADGLCLVHWMYAHGRSKYNRKKTSYEPSFEMSVGKEYYDLFDSKDNRCQMIFHGWHEIERATFNMPIRKGWAYPYQSTMQAQANGDYANEVFTQGLIGGDPDLVLFGFSHVTLMGGNEQPLREFTQLLRALPGEKFNPVLKTGLKTNLAISDLKKDGKYMFYVANPGYWPIQGSVTVKGGTQVKNLVFNESVPIKKDGDKIILPIKLKPYGVKAFMVDSADAQIVAWSNSPVPGKDLAHIRGLIAKGERALYDPAMRELTSKRDLLFIQRTVDKALNALEYGKYALAWSEATNWIYWALLHKGLVEAENFDPWLVMGPSASQKEADGTVKYSEGPIKKVGWQEIPGQKKSMPMVGYIYQKIDKSWIIGYIAMEVFSPSFQNVTLTTDTGKVSKVWINREKVNNSFERITDNNSLYKLEVPLFKGWNRILCAVDLTMNKKFGFYCVNPNNLNAQPEGLKFRLPQKDLGGPRTSYRVNCGCLKPYVDQKGQVWLPDHDYNAWATDRFGYGFLSGRPVKRLNREIEGTEDDMLYKRVRFAADGYRFMVVPGNYTVRIHFAETYKAGKGRRIFKVLTQDKEAFEIDIFEEAGMNTALVKTIKNVKVEDGILKIDFKGISSPGAQEIGAIEVIKKD